MVAPTIDALPDEAVVDKASFRSRGVQSHLGIPMRVGGTVVGLLAFGCLRRARDWPDYLVDRIGMLADVFANALAHKRAKLDLERAIDFERVVSDIQSTLLKAKPADLDDVLVRGLRDIAAVFGADRSTLWQRVADRQLFAMSHRWQADDRQETPERVPDAIAPWIVGQLLAGATVSFPSLAHLPPAATADLDGLRTLGVAAGVVVPLTVGSSVVGALSIVMTRTGLEWPAELVGRVKFVGEVLAGVVARRDAERREFQAQAESAHAARVGAMGALAASLVHELTQPLAASLANAETASELLCAPMPDTAELRATLADIVADSRRAGELVQRLRRFLRRSDAVHAEIDVPGLVDDVMRMIEHEAAAKGVEIAVERGQALPAIVGDRVQIQQVLFNLLLNAFDAVGRSEHRPKQVVLRATACDGALAIEVTDTGCGMDDATLARIFEPFFTTKRRGMGLGLSISRRIVEAHGGHLSARSIPGSGTTFRMSLPLEGSAAAAPASGAGTGTVFVIDDDPSVLRALERQLADDDVRVETFQSARDFLARPPVAAGSACVVSDVRMPGLDGIELQQTLAREGRHLPIVFISGEGDVATSVQAMKAGAVSFLPKPFKRDDLRAAVAEALRRSREDIAGRAAAEGLAKRHRSLTPREREVFDLVAAGLLNKVIADRLGAAETTIKIHRGRVMEKMGARSVADLVRMAERLGVSTASPQR